MWRALSRKWAFASMRARGPDGRHLPRRQDPRRPAKATPAGAPATRRRSTLSARLKELKLPQGRLKTGTPPRLDGRTIDYARLLEQPGDGVGPVRRRRCRCSASSAIRASIRGRCSCWITQTNARTHEIIRAGFDRRARCSPALIDGVGPRYCPSIEDKVNRFADKDSHQIFLEPEGLTTHEVYPNGISTSLPFDVQIDAVHIDRRAGGRAHPAARLRDRVRLLRSARAEAELRDAGDRRAVLRRPDQRHDRLRGGGGPRAARRRQRRARSARGDAPWVPRARPGLPRRAGRRPRDARA